jgi:adenylate cyclase
MKKRSFRLSILQTFIVLNLITGVSISLNFYYRSSGAVLELADKVTKELTDKIIERTMNFLNGPAAFTRTVSKLVHDPDIAAIHEDLWEYMWEPMMMTPQLQSFFVADARGSYVQVRREPKLATRIIDRSEDESVDRRFYRDEDYLILGLDEKVTSFDPRVRPWYRNTHEEPRIYWTDVYVSTTAQTPVIAASYPVLDPLGQKQGVVCMNVPLHSISAFVADQEATRSGRVFVINGKGELIAYPDSAQIIRKDDATGKLRMQRVTELGVEWISHAFQHYQESREEKFVYTSGGDRYIANFTRFPETFEKNWEIVILIPEAELLGAVDEMVVQSVFISLVILFVSVGAIYIIGSQFSKPIMQLATATEQIKDFNLDGVTGVRSKLREIDQMSRALLAATEGLKAFRKYVPADLVRQLIQTGQQAKLGGEARELTIFFSDIEGFTSISEGMPAQELMIHLSEYLDELTCIIMAGQGTVDKYIGDSIMAFWGAPIRQPDSAYRACRAALRCVQRLEELNERWIEEGKPPLRTRIGLHTGDAVVGNLGSDARMNYSVIGDNVNLSARLEGINKMYGTRILISEATRERVGERIVCHPVDVVAVKGKQHPVKIYELIAEFGGEDAWSLAVTSERFTEAFDAYLARDWNRALEICAELPRDFRARLFVVSLEQRCTEFRAHPERIAADWDGTTVLKTK